MDYKNTRVRDEAMKGTCVKQPQDQKPTKDMFRKIFKVFVIFVERKKKCKSTFKVSNGQ